jgi:hypothetical protein
VWQERLKHPFTPQMSEEVTEFLFNHYRVHFNSRPALATAYACIPQVMLDTPGNNLLGLISGV